MTDPAGTTFITKPENCEISGVSIRAWIAIGLCFTVCITHVLVTIATLVDAVRSGNLDKVGSLTTVGEPLYSLAIAAVAFYFGGSSPKKPTTP